MFIECSEYNFTQGKSLFPWCAVEVDSQKVLTQWAYCTCPTPATTDAPFTSGPTTSRPTTTVSTTVSSTTRSLSTPVSTTQIPSAGNSTTESSTTPEPTKKVYSTTGDSTTSVIATQSVATDRSTTQFPLQATSATSRPNSGTPRFIVSALLTTAFPGTDRPSTAARSTPLDSVSSASSLTTVTMSSHSPITTNSTSAITSRAPTTRNPTTETSSIEGSTMENSTVSTILSTDFPTASRTPTPGTSNNNKDTSTEIANSITPAVTPEPTSDQGGATQTTRYTTSSMSSINNVTKTTNQISGDKQTTTESSALYAGIGTAVGCVLLLVLLLVFLVCRRKKKKLNISSNSRVLLSDSSTIFANPVFGRTSVLDADLYVDPAEAIINRPAQTTLQTGNGYLEPTATINNTPTQMTLQAAGDDGDFLVPDTRESFRRFYSDSTHTSHQIQRGTGDDYEFGWEKSPVVTTTKPMAASDETPVSSRIGVEPENQYELLVPTSQGREGSSQQEKGRQEEEIELREIYGNQKDKNPTNNSRRRIASVAAANEEKEVIYWEPASTEQELYGQLEGRKFRHIDRRDVIDRKEIGSGEFGVVEKAVWQVKRDEKIVVAVKTLTSDSDTNSRVNFLREAAINGQFRHRNVVCLHGVVTIGSPIMLVLEFMENGDLKNYLGNQRLETSQLSPPGLAAILLRVCRDIAAGMEYLASKSFVHRDLAARNILLNEDLTCKLGDFGMARDVSDDNYYMMKGGKVPVRWCAPETWNYRKFSTASDVWSYGVVLYEVWSVGKRPFGFTSNCEVVAKVESGYRLPPPPGCSLSLYQLMIDCWNPDSHERPSFGKIVQKLKASDKSILTNRSGDAAMEGQLGDRLEVSEKCYIDLQKAYSNTDA